MANTQIVGAAKSYGLEKLNQWIKEREMLLGPVIDIDDGGASTAAEFDLEAPRVRAKWAKVSLKVGTQCVLQPGAVLIAEGRAYIAGVLQPVCLSR
ncbi:hypothetical protein [Brevundimonas sp. TWP2-3-2]|uniref:hypothetical protein n=1 Tax=unclassified Brevundimonas TaxID=2622653 RepID=UPI003CE8708F